jgi:hypothetical protein
VAIVAAADRDQVFADRHRRLAGDRGRLVSRPTEQQSRAGEAKTLRPSPAARRGIQVHPAVTPVESIA